ncbi:MAG TPA: mechanosensitive ion channel family protein [Egibacteraceae bacterium]|nr:mechanosensitive ion channel family protein [Egibacteraceae bacterium]
MPVVPTATVLAQISDERLGNVCGTDEFNPVCGWILRLTDNNFLASVGGALLHGAFRILLILIIAFFVHRLLKRAIKRFTRGLAAQTVQRFSKISGKVPLADTTPMDLSRATMRTETMGAVLNSIATFAVWAMAAMMILGVFNFNLGPLVAGAGIVGVALGFGAQNMVKDWLAGLFIILEDQYGIGDIIEMRDSMGSPGAGGTVEGISLRTTRVRDVEGVVWHVPNGEIRTAGNKSQQWARSLIDVSVAYDTNVDHATNVIKMAADSVWRDEYFGSFILAEPQVWGLERFDADALAIRLVVKVQPAKQWEVNRELRARIKRAFDAEGIEIPFPQRTVWVRHQDAPADSRDDLTARRS